MAPAVLTSIRLFPIKALDAVDVAQASILPGGGLVADRRWALFDDDGQILNGKRCPDLLRVRARFSADATRVILSADARPDSDFLLDEDPDALARWFSEFLQRPVQLRRNDETGFPDDLDAAGPTLVSTASLNEISAWFPELSAESVRRRFRANLEIAAPVAFWEDRLFGAPSTLVHFSIGDVAFVGMNPCQRCAVPARDPDSGAIWSGFQMRFSEQRQRTLPSWAASARFDHFYRFAVNTCVPTSEVGKVLRPGDEVRILGTSSAPAR